MISTLDYSREEIDRLLYMSESYNWGKHYQNRYVCLWFAQPSTRTQLSFNRAAQELGMNVSLLTEESSVKKGESFDNTIRTVEELGFDMLVIRHDQGYASKRAQDMSTMKVINAGDGFNEHPTQALIDLYTIKEEYNNLDSLRVTFVGDTVSSRVVRSLMPLLYMYGVRIGVVEKMRGYYSTIDNDVRRFDSVEDAAKWSDIVYMVRNQDEVRFGTHVSILHQMTLAILEKYNVKLMHPGPVNVTKEIREFDCITHENSLIGRQVQNSVRVRKTVLAKEIL